MSLYVVRVVVSESRYQLVCVTWGQHHSVNLSFHTLEKDYFTKMKT